jgi:hypothetical protein
MRDQDPPRLRHELGTALEHALLSAGASGVTSNETRAKTLAALGLASSATLLAGIAGASVAGSAGSAATTAVKLGWAKLMFGISAIGAATAVPVGYYYVQQQQKQAAVRAAAVRPARPSSATAVAPPPAEMPAPRPVAAPVVPRASRPAVTPRGELTQELAALDRVRVTLAGGDARGALSALDGYDRGHPNGRLELEAEVLRIEALARSGRIDAARDRGEAFLRRHPQSVLATRVRTQLRATE